MSGTYGGGLAYSGVTLKWYTAFQSGQAYVYWSPYYYPRGVALHMQFSRGSVTFECHSFCDADFFASREVTCNVSA